MVKALYWSYSYVSSILSQGTKIIDIINTPPCLALPALRQGKAERCVLRRSGPQMGRKSTKNKKKNNSRNSLTVKTNPL